MKTAVELAMTGDVVRFPLTDMSNYDSTKHNLGPLFFQGSDTWTGIGKTFIGPVPMAMARPMESNIACAAGFPHALKISSTKWAVVLGELTTANVLRRFLLYIYDVASGTFTYGGAISFTFPTAATIRGIRLQCTRHTTGTVAVSGTAVTGTGTNWLTRRVNAGARIGFGSTDPDQITNWYDIVPGTAISTNTGITLLTTAGTIAAGTAYVIEDYSLYIAATCATATDGGLRVLKGLSLSSACWSQTATATVIALATTGDNIRACMWLKDASTVTNTVAAGIAIGDESADNLTLPIYILDGASTNAKIFKYNGKAALTLSAGITTSAFTLATGTQVVVGAIAQINNGRLGTLNHGPGSGVSCFYFTTATRLYRCRVADIVSASVAFVSDSMLEVPPGGVGTYTASGAMSNLEIVSSLDRIIWFATGASAARHYVTQYRTDSSSLDHVFLADHKQTHGSTSDPGAYPHPNSALSILCSWAEDGMCFIARHGTTTVINQLYAVPLSVQWGYQALAPFNVYISPAIATPAASRYYRVAVSSPQVLGEGTNGFAPDGYRLYYRTAGITDNSGAWAEVPEDGDLSGVTADAFIQFKFEFRVITPTCITSRIFNILVVYDTDEDIPSDLRWSADDSSTTDGTVGFVQATAFTTLPTVLQIDYYRVDNSSNVLTQLSSGTTNGVFEYHNGSTWVAGLGTNTIGMRRRFRPTAGLPNGIAVFPKITVIS